MAGALYLVATPIGNLEDITLRALRVLRESDLIACEDTRHSRKLLNHFQIDRPTISLFRENEVQRAQPLVKRMLAGDQVALISDAGAPVWSDPGAGLVRAALAAGIAVVPVPGPSAVSTAWMAAGLETSPVTFVGFLPPRTGERRRALQALATLPGALILFEAPHRLAASLDDIAAVLGPNRSAVVARELTKLHESFQRGTVAEIRQRLGSQEIVGEITLVLGPPVASPPAADAVSLRLAAISGLGAEEARAQMKLLARESGLSRSELYRRWQQARDKPV